MTQLSKERLEELAAGQSGFNLRTATPEESMEMARRLLAVEGQEPVAFVKSGYALCYYRPHSEYGLKIGDKLYAAPIVAQPVQVPKGWNLVPVEPTEAMLAAAGDSVILNADEALSAYKSMLSAAPQPESE